MLGGRLGWAGLGWAGLGWAGLGCAALRCAALRCAGQRAAETIAKFHARTPDTSCQEARLATTHFAPVCAAVRAGPVAGKQIESSSLRRLTIDLSKPDGVCAPASGCLNGATERVATGDSTRQSQVDAACMHTRAALLVPPRRLLPGPAAAAAAPGER